MGEFQIDGFNKTVGVCHADEGSILFWIKDPSYRRDDKNGTLKYTQIYHPIFYQAR